MASDELTLLVLIGGSGETPVEQAVARAGRASARDVVERGLASGAFDHVLAATDDADWAETLSGLPVRLDVDNSARPFHFGRRLAGLVKRYDLQCVLYAGGGSMPLLDAAGLAAIATYLRQNGPGLVTNNLHSSDWAGITPAGSVLDFEGDLTSDNALGWTLWRQAGLRLHVWPRSAASLLDLDTPTDIQIAAMHPACGPHLRAWVQSLGWADDRLRAVREALYTEARQVILAGRVPQYTWAHVESRTMCWLRVFSEERGMRASQRLARGQVRSLLAEHLAQVGASAFFETLAQLADAALIDSRVIMAARRPWPSPADRFYSDRLQPEPIGDPFVRDFTQAAREARIPVVLGGHALVAGGLWALLETE